LTIFSRLPGLFYPVMLQTPYYDPLRVIYQITKAYTLGIQAKRVKKPVTNLLGSQTFLSLKLLDLSQERSK